MSGELGICLQGSHPRLREETKLDNNLIKIVHESYHTTSSNTTLNSHPEFITPSYQIDSINEVHPNEMVNCASCITDAINLHTKSEKKELDSFIMGEELCTSTTPRCGACKCGKCPTAGHTYSFKEEQELRQIQDNLRYDEQQRCWITSYPWVVNPNNLPDNDKIVYSILLNTEITLSKDTQWASTYKAQIEDMVERKVAMKLTKTEIEEWSGPHFYICHLAVVNPKSQSTPVRIVFNSSQVFNGISLNSCLAKEPDAYLNKLVGLLLRWREEDTAVIGDIRKMFNSVHLEPLEQHCHRFLWRDLQPEEKPHIYVITRVNMGDKPAPAISTEAINKTAELFGNNSPRVTYLLKKCSYVDDLIDSFESQHEAKKITSETETILNMGGFYVKCWQFSKESMIDTKKSTGESQTLLKGTEHNLRVLGLGWKADQDVMVFEVTLNFSRKKKGQRTGPNLQKEDIPHQIPQILTRRIVLEQVIVIYDPLGLICPFTLLAKLYLRETWALKLGWDAPLPNSLHSKWLSFFKTMFEFENLQYERCLHPKNAVGNPSLVIFSDGSNLAYGFAAYIWWKLEDGINWFRLIMAKCRISPINRISTPQMELNGAVLSKRAGMILQKEMRFQFERVLHLVDSETVLNMLNKTSTRFKVYEGVRIGEIQASSKT